MSETCATCDREVDNAAGVGHCPSCIRRYDELHGAPSAALVLVISGSDAVQVFRQDTLYDFRCLPEEVLSTPTVAGTLAHYAADAVPPDDAGFSERLTALIAHARPSRGDEQ